MNSTTAPIVITSPVETEFNRMLDSISNIIGYYLITVVSMIGLILNLASIRMLRHKSLKHKFYKYLLGKSICDSFVCLIGIGYLNSNSAYSLRNLYNTYLVLFYQINIIRTPMRCAFFISTSSEVCLTFIRILAFSMKINTLNNTLIKYYVAYIIFVSCTFTIPPYFAVEILPSNVTGIYYWTSNQFGLSTFYKYYIFVILFIESVIPTMLLIIFNLIILFKYQKRMNEKHRLNIHSINSLKTSDMNFNKMILVLTGIFFATHLCDMILAIVIRYYYFFSRDDIKIPLNWASTINFLRQLVYLMQITQYAFNIFIYVGYDPNLHKIFSLSLFKIKFLN